MCRLIVALMTVREVVGAPRLPAWSSADEQSCGDVMAVACRRLIAEP